MPDKTIQRQSVDADVVVVGFGPAAAGFLTTLAKGMLKEDGTPAVESRVAPGMPLQVLCYERADDIGFGVSGVESRARAIKASLPDLDWASAVPLSSPILAEKLVYLMDPLKASRRSWLLKVADFKLRLFRWFLPVREHGFEFPLIPPFLKKHGGYIFSMGQFMSHVGSRLMGTGAVQIWPSTPVAQALVEDGAVKGVRLADQGVDKTGKPDANYMPGMDVHARLTVVADGPQGAVGRRLDSEFGLPKGNEKWEWAVGMKAVIQLPEGSGLAPGTVIHTFGYPEPEIFGFLYCLPGNMASAGIFVPSWFSNPVRTSYRYLQHWMLHPYIWRYLKGGTLVSWGAKSLLESGMRGEPVLAVDGAARIGEGSGSTNVLTGSGVDEAWQTGVLLADGALELLKADKPLTRANLEEAYVTRRRKSWVEKEARVAKRSRDGFGWGFVAGMAGMGLAGMTLGWLNVPGRHMAPAGRLKKLEDYFGAFIPRGILESIRTDADKRGVTMHDAVMDRLGWPPTPFDGKLLVTLQDALLMGGKVQAPAGYADHVVFRSPELCRACDTKVCVEMCSAEAIHPGPDGVPAFDREKCVHCGACIWNCSRSVPGKPGTGNLDFRAGAGGLHSAEN